MTEWFRSGQLKDRVDVAKGLDVAPEALQRLHDGENTGKQIVRVGLEVG